MDSLPYITFVITSVALIVVPGPNVLVVVATSIAHGVMRGLQTVLGTSSAMALQLIIAALGTTWLVTSIAEGFEWLRWFGVVYLLYLGVTNLSSLMKKANDGKVTVTVTVTGKASYGRGFIVSLTNPKTILFFTAFMPQFVAPDRDYMNQIIILSITFFVLATLFDGLYAFLAGRMRGLIQGVRVQKVHSGVSGLLFLGAGVWLAAMRRN